MPVSEARTGKNKKVSYTCPKYPNVNGIVEIDSIKRKTVRSQPNLSSNGQRNLFYANFRIELKVLLFKSILLIYLLFRLLVAFFRLVLVCLC